MASMSSGRTLILCSVPQQEMEPLTTFDDYPVININGELLNSSIAQSAGYRTCHLWHNVLVPVDEGVGKRIIRTFFENGFAQALNEARDVQTVQQYPIVATVADYLFRMCEFVNQMKAIVFPHAKEQGAGSVALHSQTRDWLNSFTRCIAWHPNSFKIAVAGADDVVRIFTDEAAVVPVLKSMEQRWITSMSWRPHTAAELAVGCKIGICLWSMDANMQIMRNASQAIVLKHPNHGPVMSVEWNSQGTLLASCSIGDGDVVIWDVDKQKSMALKRIGPPCSLIKWSPGGDSLFSATVSNVFRVWSAENRWQSERWTISPGYTIRSACWSPCNTFIVFVTSADPLLYKLEISEKSLFKYSPTDSTSCKQAVPIANLKKCIVGNRVIGGYPQALAWDPSGFVLAVTFKDSPCIAIFSMCIQTYTLTCSPMCFIAGIGSEVPAYICFQSNHRKNTRTVLTIGWSSGRIQYYPFSTM